MKEWWNVTEEDQKAILDATTWNAADLGYFRGGGYSSRFLTTAEMPATMIRLNLVKGLGPVLQIAEGWTVKLPDEVPTNSGNVPTIHGPAPGSHRAAMARKARSRLLTM